MVYLTGDCVFMEFLAKHPMSHHFTVGPSTVVLKGGIRKPPFLMDKPKSQFTWTKTVFTPALLEPVYSLKPSSIDPPAFKGLAFIGILLHSDEPFHSFGALKWEIGMYHNWKVSE